MLVRIKETESLIHSWWECKMVHELWTIVGQFLKKIKCVLTICLSNCTFEHLSQGDENKFTQTPVHECA